MQINMINLALSLAPYYYILFQKFVLNIFIKQNIIIII